MGWNGSHYCKRIAKGEKKRERQKEIAISAQECGGESAPFHWPLNLTGGPPGPGPRRRLNLTAPAQ